MKKLICVSCLLFIGISTYLFAETKQVINSKNEFGGKTIMLIFSSGDNAYKEGIAKTIAYYDSKEKLVKTESFYTDESAKKDGVARGIDYFDSKQRMVKAESFFTDKSAKKDGVAKSITYLDSNEKIAKTEFYDRKGKLLSSK